jgi:putative transposase
MPAGLIRYEHTGHQHFLTFSCWQRRPYLGSADARDLFVRSLEQMRIRYGFLVVGYVVMPEHVHLLVTEPSSGSLATAIQAVKLSVARQRHQRHCWLNRYYDFVVYSEKKRVEKLRYIHRNPVRRRLVERPEDWAWSSFRHYQTGLVGPVEIESWWTDRRRRSLLESEA